MVNVNHDGCGSNRIAREATILVENGKLSGCESNCDSVIFWGRSVSSATTRLCLSCLSKVGKVWHFFIDLQGRPFLKTLIEFFEKKFTGICIKSGNLYTSFNFNFGPVTIIESGCAVENEQKVNDSQETVEESAEKEKEIDFLEDLDDLRTRVLELESKNQAEKNLFRYKQSQLKYNKALSRVMIKLKYNWKKLHLRGRTRKTLVKLSQLYVNKEKGCNQRTHKRRCK